MISFYHSLDLVSGHGGAHSVEILQVVHARTGREIFVDDTDQRTDYEKRDGVVDDRAETGVRSLNRRTECFPWQCHRPVLRFPSRRPHVWVVLKSEPVADDGQIAEHVERPRVEDLEGLLVDDLGTCNREVPLVLIEGILG